MDGLCTRMDGEYFGVVAKWGDASAPVWSVTSHQECDGVHHFEGHQVADFRHRRSDALAELLGGYFFEEPADEEMIEAAMNAAQDWECDPQASLADALSRMRAALGVRPSSYSDY